MQATTFKTQGSRRSLVLVLIVAAVILTPHFYKNQWHLVDQRRFDGFQNDEAESLAVWGLVESAQEGLAASRFKLHFPGGHSGMVNWWSASQEAYVTGTKMERFEPYSSQIGLQGFVYSFARPLVPLRNETYLRLLRFANSLLLALSIGVVAWWITSLVPSVSASILVILAAFAPFLAVIGRNLYWVPWTWLLPALVAIGAVARRQGTASSAPRARELLAIGVAVFVKSACGYEYVSAVLVAMMLPFVGADLVTRRPWRVVLPEWVATGFAGCAGFATAILVHSIQRSSLLGIGDGLRATFFDAAKRTTQIADSSGLSRMIADSLKVPVGEVLAIYRETCVLDLPRILCIDGNALLAAVVLAWLLLAVLWIVRRRRAPEMAPVAVLGVVVSLAALGPLSWFALAKGHSYIHQVINPVLWAAPFSMLAVAFVWATVAAALAVTRWPSVSRWISFLVAISVLIALPSACQDLGLAYKLVFASRSPAAIRYGRDVAPTVVFDRRSITFVVRNPTRFDARARFFVHVFPRDNGRDRQASGFDNEDFDPEFQRIAFPRWSVFSRTMVFRQELPLTYDIQKVLVGQYTLPGGQRLWEAEIHPQEIVRASP